MPPCRPLGDAPTTGAWPMAASGETPPATPSPTWCAFKGAVSLKGMGSYSARHAAESAFVGLDHWTPGAAAARWRSILIRARCASCSTRPWPAELAGKTIHHLSAQRQVEGGLIMGLGNALFEELRYEEGQLQNADAFQYRLPLLRDVPRDLSVSIIENGDGPGPFGAKGMSRPPFRASPRPSTTRSATRPACTYGPCPLPPRSCSGRWASWRPRGKRCGSKSGSRCPSRSTKPGPSCGKLSGSPLACLVAPRPSR